MPYKDPVMRRLVVRRYKQGLKKKLVEAHGGKCFDCKETFPAFIFEFDHREPELKSFQISKSTKYDLMYEESLKCDMVCPNCHRFREHRRDCGNCEYCLSRIEP